MIIIFLGPPGAGKGTIASEINKIFSIPIIATGEIMRNAIKSNSDLGKEIENYVVLGKLVPDKFVMKVVEDRIKDSDCEKGFIFDGFPRTLNQAKELDSVLYNLNKQIDHVFYFDIPNRVIINRLSARRICPVCGTIYNLNSDPPRNSGICNECDSELIQRTDDEEETIKERLTVYNEETLPLVDYYQKKNILTKINADQEINSCVKDISGKLLKLGVVEIDKLW